MQVVVCHTVQWWILHYRINTHLDCTLRWKLRKFKAFALYGGDSCASSCIFIRKNFHHAATSMIKEILNNCWMTRVQQKKAETLGMSNMMQLYWNRGVLKQRNNREPHRNAPVVWSVVLRSAQLLLPDLEFSLGHTFQILELNKRELVHLSTWHWYLELLNVQLTNLCPTGTSHH